MGELQRQGDLREVGRRRWHLRDGRQPELRGV